MRQIATLPDEGAARKFADYLLTLQIATKLEPEGGGFAVWVCDEDRVDQARQELEAFTRNSADARYTQAVPAAQALRQLEAEKEKAYSRRQAALEKKMRTGGYAGRPLTMVLLMASVAVTLLTNFGKQDNSPLLEAMWIAPYQQSGGYIYWYGLSALKEGQWWRLVTPIFLHLNIAHLVMNMLTLLWLGGPIESNRGTLKLLGLVLVTAVVSNLAEYYFSWSFPEHPIPTWSPSPAFGGMSGVLYGLFGYLWMKSRYQPELGLYLPKEAVAWLLFWFFLCLTGTVGPIGNVCHGAGLLTGVLLGVLPLLWRRRS